MRDLRANACGPKALCCVPLGRCIEGTAAALTAGSAGHRLHSLESASGMPVSRLKFEALPHAIFLQRVTTQSSATSLEARLGQGAFLALRLVDLLAGGPETVSHEAFHYQWVATDRFSRELQAAATEGAHITGSRGVRPTRSAWTMCGSWRPRYSPTRIFWKTGCGSMRRSTCSGRSCTWAATGW